MPARPLSRRTLLRGAGVALALPLLDAMRPASRAASRRDGAGPAEGGDEPRRQLAICSNMGMMPEFFVPEGRGADYVDSEYLRIIDRFRGRYTVITGASHPEVDGGHHADICFLTAAPHPGRGGFRNTISLDQFAAERIGVRTRFPSLALKVGVENHIGLSWTSGGSMIPPESSPSGLYKRLFLRGDAGEVERRVDRLREGRSVLDAVADRARSLGRGVGPRDRDKLDRYFTSVRELERRLVDAERWERRPKPAVDEPMPEDIDDRAALIGKTRLMYRMARLALQTDSTRLITLMIDENHNPTPRVEGVTRGHHSLTHHGHREDSVAELKRIEAAQFEVLGELLEELDGSAEGGASLLDRTMVLYGSNLGDANTHDNRNLPVLLAGGGFRHGRHLAFDRRRNRPLPDLFVSILQRLGVEADRFASGTGTLPGLEPA